MSIKCIALLPSEDQEDQIMSNVRKINERRDAFNIIMKKSYLNVTKKTKVALTTSFDKQLFQLMNVFFSRCLEVEKNNRAIELHKLSESISKPNKFQYFCENNPIRFVPDSNESQILKFATNQVDLYILTDLLKSWKDVVILGAQFPSKKMSYAHFNVDKPCLKLEDSIPILGGILIKDPVKISIEPTRIFFIMRNTDNYTTMVRSDSIFN